MTQVAPQTLDVVGRELASTLGEARGLLERFVEQPDEIALLERCSEELHRAQGVLRVLEIYGAALLAEDMEQVTRFLLSEPDRRAVLRQAADERGVFLSDEVMEFMLTRFSRDLGSLMELLDLMDGYALQTKRAITIPLIKAMMDEA